MRVIFRPEARIVLDEIGDFIDSINLEGSGVYWTEKFISHLYSYALPNVNYALCRNEELAAYGFSCLNYNDWIIAFTLKDELFTVHKIVRGSNLV